MAKPAHTRLTWKGFFGAAGAPAEEWQFSLGTLEDVTALTQAARTTLATALVTAWAATLANVTPNYCSLAGAEVRRIGADGLEPRGTDGAFSGQGFSESGVTAGGSSGSAVYPPQCSMVVSLMTARAGATGKGRIFLPPPSANVDSTAGFLIPASDATAIRDEARNLIVALNALVGLPIAVVSSKGYASEVTGVKCGRVIDTQRSRRHRMPETYSVRTLAAS